MKKKQAQKKAPAAKKAPAKKAVAVAKKAAAAKKAVVVAKKAPAAAKKVVDAKKAAAAKKAVAKLLPTAPPVSAHRDQPPANGGKTYTDAEVQSGVKKAVADLAAKAPSKVVTAPPKPLPPALDRALNIHNLNLAKLASGDNSRFTLRAIHVTDTATIVTDGTQLTMVDLAKQPLSDSPSIPGMTLARTWKPFNLQADVALDVAKALPKKPALPACGLAYIGDAANSEGNIEIGLTDLDSPRTFRPKVMSGNFPDYKRVVPDPNTSHYQIVVDAEILAAVLEYVRKFGISGGRCPIKFSFWKHNMNKGSQRDAEPWVPKSFTLEADNAETGQHLLSVIMPMRGGFQTAEFNGAAQLYSPDTKILAGSPPQNGTPQPRPPYAPAAPTPAPRQPAAPAQSSAKTLCRADDPRYAGMTPQERAWITIRHKKGAHKHGEQSICPLCEQAVHAA